MKFYVYDFSTNKKIDEVEIDTESSLVSTAQILNALGVEKTDGDTFEYNGEIYDTYYISCKPELKAPALKNIKIINQVFRKKLVELDRYGNVLSSVKVELDKDGRIIRTIDEE